MANATASGTPYVVDVHETPATDGVPLRPRRRVDPVWFLTAFVALVGLSLVGTVPSEPLSDLIRVPGVVLAVWLITAEVLSAHITYRDSGVDTTLNGVPLIIGTAFTPTHEMVIWLSLGAFVALLGRTDQWRKVWFNLGLVPLQVGVILVSVNHLFGRPAPESLAGAGAFAGGLLLADVATLIAVIAVLRIASGVRSPRGVMLRTYVLSVATTSMSALLGLAAVWAAHVLVAGLWVVAALSAAIAILVRLAANRIEHSHRLAALERAVIEINAAADGGELQSALVAQARAVLHTNSATLLLRTPRGRVAIGGPDDELGARVMEDGVPARERRRRYWRVIAPGSTTDAVAVPIGSARPADAVLVARDSVDAFESLTAADLRLLGDLARHASAALEQHRLVDLLKQEIITTERAARTDALTQLPNRAGLLDSLAGPGRSGLLVLASVRGVDDVAAAFGRAVADALLIEVATRLTTLAGPRRCARLADATFAVWVAASRDTQATCADVAETLSGLPVKVDRVDLAVDLVIGAVPVTDGLDPDELLRRAGVALAAASDRPVAYTPELDDDHARRLRLTRELRDALRSDQLTLHYQPKADMQTGQLVGVEALARWIHPEFGFVPPLEFVALAERSGTIGHLTAWAIQRACREAAAWAREGKVIPVAVNLSPRDLLDPSLPLTVAEALRTTSLDPALLRLEITESVMVVDPERSRQVVDHLRSTGVSVSIDDFGSGYASFGHLRRFAVDELKIDRSLVMELDVHGDAIVRAIVALALELGLKTVAEGVEDDATWQRLADAGVDACQGWVLAKPMPPADLAAWLQENPARLVTAV